MEQVLKAMDGIKRAWEGFTVSLGQAASAFTVLAEVFAELEQAETRQRVLNWEGVWLWK